jgi:beta-1,4-mannosyl-glycoprotein beta-1,4-N-acetylglucosaminyltransferase
MRKIVDISLINDELHILDLRVKILEDIVDKFYVVQATKTFSGLKKKCLSSEDYSHPKVEFVTIDFPDGLDTWSKEYYQRNYKVDLSSYSPDDLVLLSDLDEVPNPEVLKQLSENFDINTIYGFSQIMHQYFLNNQNTSELWAGTRALSVEKYSSELTPQQVRMSAASILLKDGGWHWSFLGDEESLRNKIISYSHQEHNNNYTLDSIIYRLNNNEDIFERGFVLKAVEIDETYPKYVRENQDKLEKYIKRA